METSRADRLVLTEESAWRLLLALEPGQPSAVEPALGPRLDLDGAGGWTTDPEAGVKAATLLEIFVPLRRRPTFVVGQLGQSLDGRIATASGHSHYINGPEDIRRLHRLRALADAVVVGAGTVQADDPRLTVREVEGPNPVRVILDPSGRLPPDRNVFRDGAAPTVWIQGEETDLVSRTPVDVLTLPVDPRRGFDLRQVLDCLAERGLRRVLVEGGGVTVSRFLAARLLDRLHVSVAPLILGSGRLGIQLPPVGTLDEAMRPPVRHFRLGRDLLFDLDLAASTT